MKKNTAIVRYLIELWSSDGLHCFSVTGCNRIVTERANVAEDFGVSRTPIREEFRPLASISLVEDLRRRGVLVSKHSASDLLDAFLVLADLEGIPARLAAQHTSDEVL
jgi:DNA-binding GntR family transcriptional regulator